jgi:transcriptional regulator GlxA family with amidase domain
VKEAAHALALSPRAMQRLLADARTSFRKELAATRSESAAELLEATNGTLAAVARRMGISVGTLMSTMRRSTGLTPSAYRRRRRGAP